jgi:uncharacterized membrane protein
MSEIQIALLFMLVFSLIVLIIMAVYLFIWRVVKQENEELKEIIKNECR